MSSPLLASIDRIHEGAPHRVKDEEKAMLFREICVGRSPTRQGLARRLDIRPSSVSEAVQELIDDGLITETQARSKGRSGRPRAMLAPRSDRFVAISLYVDSREMKAVLSTLTEEVIVEEVREIPPTADNKELETAILSLLRRMPDRVPAGAWLVGAGLSLVGTVNAQTRTWMSAARWPRLQDLDLSSIERRVGFPLLIRRTNETELEYYLDCTHRARGSSLLLLHWGFGIGSAMSFRGAQLTSSLGRFGEIGHARLGSDPDAPCLCGLKGCLETDAALWALLPRLREKVGDLPEDENELAPFLRDQRLLSLPEMKRAVRAVESALLVLCMIFYPDTILLSGPFTENPSIFESLAGSVRRSLPGYAREAVTFSPIPGGLSGCRRGGANPLFREALGRALRRKT